MNEKLYLHEVNAPHDYKNDRALPSNIRRTLWNALVLIAAGAWLICAIFHK